MRDESLFFLFSPISRVKGIGDATARNLARLLPTATALSGDSTPLVRDLIFHLPTGLLDRRFMPSLVSAPEGVIATFVVHVDAHTPPKLRGKPYRVLCSNDTGDITLIFFHAHTDYIKQALPEGSTRAISGRTERFDFRLQMSHPDIITTPDKLEDIQKPEAIYPLTVGLTSRRIAKYIDTALQKLPDLPEWIDEEFMREHHFPSWKNALQQIHQPTDEDALSPLSPARTRLAYDEMLAGQLHLTMLRRNRSQQQGAKISGNTKLTSALLKSLPFKLTAGQLAVVDEIAADMNSGKRMGRLLQGDVGSGKTIVALLAMLRATEQSLQSALMVPTEIIAQQHYETLRKLCEPLGVTVTCLTGSVKGKARKDALEAITDGSAHIVVGTHALFQEHVQFDNLALVVIDEQHRFGVAQRQALTSKGAAPHLLHMTATPIPRSLTMTLYGDMECSILREKPAERLPITTRTIPLSRYQEIMQRLAVALDKGEKVYWICPLIEEATPAEGQLNVTPDSDIAAAEFRFTEFKIRFPGKVSLVHGRMKADARDAEMRRFHSGETRLLVATTVVEVGVDVRDATIIVIEKAERFGLSQLHQLRGRVGRGDQPSSCVLLFSDKTSEIGQTRLTTLRNSEDGFEIAEADLKIRGSGDLLGSRQSGLPRFIFMDILEHHEMLDHARENATLILNQDPQLTTPRGKALQNLLDIFS